MKFRSGWCLLALPLVFASCGDESRPDGSEEVKTIGKAEPVKPAMTESQPSAPAADGGLVTRMAAAIARATDSIDRAELYSRAKSLKVPAAELIPVLKKGLEDKEGVVRAAALDAIAALDAAEAAGAAAQCLADRDTEVRTRALAALEAAPVLNMDLLVGFVREEVESAVQLAGMLVLEKRLDAPQAERVTAVLGALDPKAAAPGLRLARKFTVKSAVPKIAGFVNCHDEEARLLAAEALGALGATDTDSLKALVRALMDESLRVRRASHAALKTLSGKSVPYDPEADEIEREDAQTAWKEALFGK